MIRDLRRQICGVTIGGVGNKGKMRSVSLGNLVVPPGDGEEHLSGHQGPSDGRPFSWTQQVVNRNGQVQLELGPGKTCDPEEEGQDLQKVLCGYH